MNSEERRVRVLHLIDSLDLGGAQTALFAWLEAHDRSRFEVHFAAMHGTPKSLFYERARGLKIPVILLSPKKWVPLYLFRLPPAAGWRPLRYRALSFVCFKLVRQTARSLVRYSGRRFPGPV